MRSVVCLVAPDHPRVDPRSGCPAARDPGVSPSAPRAEPIAASATAAHAGRPNAVDLAVEILEPMACGRGDRQARDGPRLASSRLPSLLDVEEPMPQGSTEHSSERPPVDSNDGGSQPVVGRATHSRRTLEAQHRRQPVTMQTSRPLKQPLGASTNGRQRTFPTVNR